MSFTISGSMSPTFIKGDTGPQGQKGEKGDRGDYPPIEQTGGQGTTSVMSQKAVTDGLDTKLPTENANQPLLMDVQWHDFSGNDGADLFFAGNRYNPATKETTYSSVLVSSGNRGFLPAVTLTASGYNNGRKGLMTPSMLKDLNDTKSGLAAETTARQQADNALENKIASTETMLKADLNDTKSGLANEITRAKGIESGLSARISAQEGLGGALNAYNFGTATPTQTQLTNYALSQIQSITNPTDIWNSTWVVNLFDGNAWQLNNTQNTNPKVFEWVNVGPEEIALFTNSVAGLFKGSTKDGEVTANSDGTGKVVGFENKADKSEIGDITTIEQILINEGWIV